MVSLLVALAYPLKVIRITGALSDSFIDLISYASSLARNHSSREDCIDLIFCLSTAEGFFSSSFKSKILKTLLWKGLSQSNAELKLDDSLKSFEQTIQILSPSNVVR